MKLLFAAALALFALSPASAQNSMQSGSGALISSMSPAELISVLQNGGLNASYMQQNDAGSHYVEVNQNGAVLYFALRDCQGMGAAARCGIVQPFGFFKADGLTFSQLNDFNINKSGVSVTGMTPDGRGIAGAKFYLQAGVSANHVPFSIGLFFVDLDTIVQSVIPGTLADVRYDIVKSAPGKIGNGAGDVTFEGLRLSKDIEWGVNAVGANAPTFMTDAFREYMSAAR